jgi:DNA polymerase-3 subunit beta
MEALTETAPVSATVNRTALVRAVTQLCTIMDKAPEKKDRRYGESHGANIARQSVRLSADGEHLTVRHASTACDVSVRLPCSGVLPDVMVGARTLTACAASMPANVTLSITGGGDLAIEGDGATCTLASLDTTGGKPPIAPFDGPALVLTAANLRALLDRTVYAIAPNDNRYGLSGIHLEREGDNLRAVATDGNRMAIAETAYTGELTMSRKRLLSGTMVRLIALLAPSSDVSLTFADKQVCIAWEGVTIAGRLLEADFPDYRQVLPPAYKRTVIMDRDALLTALRRVAPLARDSARSTRLEVQAGGVTFTTKALDIGTAKMRVPAGLTGDPIVFGINCGFLAAAVRPLAAGPVEIAIGDTLSPTRVRSLADLSAQAIVMPIRID